MSDETERDVEVLSNRDLARIHAAALKCDLTFNQLRFVVQDVLAERIAEARREGAAEALTAAADAGPSSTPTDELWRIWLRGRVIRLRSDA